MAITDSNNNAVLGPDGKPVYGDLVTFKDGSRVLVNPDGSEVPMPHIPTTAEELKEQEEKRAQTEAELKKQVEEGKITEEEKENILAKSNAMALKDVYNTAKVNPEIDTRGNGNYSYPY